MLRFSIGCPRLVRTIVCLAAAGSILAQVPAPVRGVPASYILGPDDQVIIRVLEVEELSEKTAVVDSSGTVNLPMVGRVEVAGLSLQQAEKRIEERLRKYVKRPSVALSIVDFRSQPVSVIGAVNKPGIVQLQGRKTLVEVLSLAGGIRSDAGYQVKIARRLDWGSIGLATAANDPTGQFSVADVDLKSIMSASHPEQNIQVLPHDVITVPRAEMVYVVGEVRKAGGFVLQEREKISVLQALSLSEGPLGTASLKAAKILRSEAEAGGRTEIAVNLKEILNGRQKDLPMVAQDILFVPSNTSRKVSIRVLEAAIQAGTGIVIWRR